MSAEVVSLAQLAAMGEEKLYEIVGTFSIYFHVSKSLNELEMILSKNVREHVAEASRDMRYYADKRLAFEEAKKYYYLDREDGERAIALIMDSELLVHSLGTTYGIIASAWFMLLQRMIYYDAINGRYRVESEAGFAPRDVARIISDLRSFVAKAVGEKICELKLSETQVPDEIIIWVYRRECPNCEMIMNVASKEFIQVSRLAAALGIFWHQIELDRLIEDPKTYGSLAPFVMMLVGRRVGTPFAIYIDRKRRVFRIWSSNTSDEREKLLVPNLLTDLPAVFIENYDEILKSEAPPPPKPAKGAALKFIQELTQRSLSELYAPKERKAPKLQAVISEVIGILSKEGEMELRVLVRRVCENLKKKGITVAPRYVRDIIRNMYQVNIEERDGKLYVSLQQ